MLSSYILKASVLTFLSLSLVFCYKIVVVSPFSVSFCVEYLPSLLQNCPAMLLVGANWLCSNSVPVWPGNLDLAGNVPTRRLLLPSCSERSYHTQVTPYLLAFISRGYFPSTSFNRKNGAEWAQGLGAASHALWPCALWPCDHVPL